MGDRTEDDLSEDEIYELDKKKISEILEDIMEHLKRDTNYQRSRYVMLVPRRTNQGESISLQQSNPASNAGHQTMRKGGVSGIQIESD
jgi:hypothetical protein